MTKTRQEQIADKIDELILLRIKGEPFGNWNDIITLEEREKVKRELAELIIESACFP